MADPTPKTPAPDVLAVDVTGLLTGKTAWTAAFGQELLGALMSASLTVLLVLGLAWVGLRAYIAAIDNVFKVINANLKPDAAMRMTQRSNTLSGILRSLGKVVIVFMAAMIILSKLGVNVAPILASAGIVGLAVGFGAQSLVKDIISGFFILVEDQYGVGDVIEIGTMSGIVEKMNLRITQIRNQAGSLITIPNGEIKTVVNQSKEWSQAVLDVGVAYQHDPDQIIAVLKAVGEELQTEMPDQILSAVEVLGVEAFRESEVTFKLTIKTMPLAQWAVARAYRRKLWYRFQQEGIEIPYPQRTLWLKSVSDESAGPIASMLPQSADPAMAKADPGLTPENKSA
ncbi:MAG: mechanosensitive ion channel family protein [Candidatus Sericytochromatia bacterium]